MDITLVGNTDGQQLSQPTIITAHQVTHHHAQEQQESDMEHHEHEHNLEDDGKKRANPITPERSDAEKRKRRKRNRKNFMWDAPKDILLLKEALRTRAFLAKHGSIMKMWDDVADYLNKLRPPHPTFSVKGRTCSERVKHVLEVYSLQGIQPLQRGGSQHDYDQLASLLKDAVDIIMKPRKWVKPLLDGPLSSVLMEHPEPDHEDSRHGEAARHEPRHEPHRGDSHEHPHEPSRHAQSNADGPAHDLNDSQPEQDLHPQVLDEEVLTRWEKSFYLREQQFKKEMMQMRHEFEKALEAQRHQHMMELEKFRADLFDREQVMLRELIRAVMEGKQDQLLYDKSHSPVQKK